MTEAANRYPLANLLDVRRYREDAAGRALARAHEALREAVRSVEGARDACEKYRVWRTEEIHRRYEAILGSIMTKEGLERFSRSIASLDAEAHRLDLALDEAEARREACRKALEAAQAASLAARKSAAKIEKHRSIWLEEEKKEAERAEDREFEEFRPTGRLGDASDDLLF